MPDRTLDEAQPEHQANARGTVFLVHGRHASAVEQMVRFFDALKLSVLTWREVRRMTGATTPTTMEIVKTGIENAQCVVVLLTGDDLAKLKPHFGDEAYRSQPRPNVIFEAGWALGTVGTDKTVLVTLDPVDLLTDIDGLSYIALDNSAAKRRDLTDRVRSAGCDPDTAGDAWLESPAGGDFALAAITDVDPQSELPQEALGGLFTEWVVDSALNLQLSHAALLREMTDAIKQHRRLDLKHHYVGTRMAEWWVKVCADASYGHEFLAQATTETIKDIVNAAGLSTAKVDFVSLGCGDGETDVYLLDELRRSLQVEFYYPVDISLDLLQLAVNAVLQGQEPRSPGGFRIKAILADFERNLGTLEPFFNLSDATNFYSLAGYTFGNSKEDATMEALLDVMRPHDVVLVDARLHDAGTIRQDSEISDELAARLKKPYSSEAVYQFAFGPVQVASDFEIKPRDVEFDHELHVGRVTSVPSGINVFLVCRGLEGHSAFGAHFGTGRGWRPLRIRQRDTLQLATVTYYDRDSLCEWFKWKGFDVVWDRVFDEFGLFLLRPTVTS
jgi:hypothetical protein